MRKFTLYTPDKSRFFDLNGERVLAAEPTGLGNNFSIAYQESEKKKYVTNVKPDFEPITLKIYFNADGTSGYVNYKNLMTFLGYCATSTFLLEYNDGINKKFCDVILKNAPKTEISEEGIFAETFTFERQSYWYEEIAEVFSLQSIDNNLATFPLGFPFGFAGKTFINQFVIQNEFYEAAPAIIHITGSIANNIAIYLKDENNILTISEIALNKNNSDGTKITIDANTKKITVSTEKVETNGYDLTDKSKQSFLFIPKGTYNISSNLKSTDAGQIKISLKRYLFD